MSKIFHKLAPIGVIAAATAVTAHAEAAPVTTQVFDVGPAAEGDSVAIAIGPQGTPAQYNYFKNGFYELSTNGNAQINPMPFSTSGLPSQNETYASEPNGLDLAPSTGGDVYYHLNFDIGQQTYVGTADFNSDVSQLNSVTYTSAAPEPPIWAELILGLGGAGYAMRRAQSRRQRLTMA